MMRALGPTTPIILWTLMASCTAPDAASPSRGAGALVGHLDTRERRVELTVEAFDRAAAQDRNRDDDEREGEERLDLREMRAREVMADISPEKVPEER